MRHVGLHRVCSWVRARIVGVQCRVNNLRSIRLSAVLHGTCIVEGDLGFFLGDNLLAGNGYWLGVFETLVLALEVQIADAALSDRWTAVVNGRLLLFLISLVFSILRNLLYHWLWNGVATKRGKLGSIDVADALKRLLIDDRRFLGNAILLLAWIRLLCLHQVELESLVLLFGLLHELSVQLPLVVRLDCSVDKFIITGRRLGNLINVSTFHRHAALRHSGILQLLVVDVVYLVPESLQDSFIEYGGPDIVVTLELLNVLLGHVEEDAGVEQERVRNVILSVTLQVEDQSELIVDKVLLLQSFEQGHDLLPELREPNSGNEDPGASASCFLNDLDWRLLPNLTKFLVRVVKLLSKSILEIIELTKRSMSIRANIASLEVAGGHQLQFGVLLLSGVQGSCGIVHKVRLDQVVPFDIDASLTLHHHHVGFVISPYNIQADSVVLCNGADGVDHIDMSNG